MYFDKLNNRNANPNMRTLQTKGKTMLPKIIKDAALSVEGVGYAGIIDNIEWPKITRKTEEYRAGGMFGPVDIDLGQEKMELMFEAAEQTAEIIAAYGVCGMAGVKFRINASAESEMNCESHGIEAVMTGRIREIDLGTSKPGELKKPNTPYPLPPSNTRSMAARCSISTSPTTSTWSMAWICWRNAVAI